MNGKFLYDLKLAPLSFDFVTFLACAMSVAHGYKLEHLEIIIDSRVTRKIGGIESSYPQEYIDRKIKSLFIEFQNITPWVSKYTHIRSGGETLKYSDYTFPFLDSDGQLITPYYFWNIQKFYKKFEANLSSCVRSSEHLVDHYKRRIQNSLPSIAFHVRRSSFNESRNSPADLFCRVANYLTTLDFNVFVVDDMDAILNGNNLMPLVERVQTDMDMASFSVNYRLALASSVDLNITWGGGVSHMFWFSDVNYISFGMHDEQTWISSRSSWIRKTPYFQGQFEWSDRARQILDWTEASLLNDDYVLDRILSTIESIRIGR
jgi:hypothetical protein